MLDEVVQQEPAGSLDPELMGSIAAIGIVKGQPFAPDERMKRILTEAVAVANATARSLFMSPRDPGWYYLPRLGLDAAYDVRLRLRLRDPAAGDRGAGAGRRAHARRGQGLRRRPATARWMRAPASFTASSASARPMAMRLSGIGSQYLMATVDADKQYFDGAKTYKANAAQGHPGEELLVLDALRQPDALDARHAAALSARRQPELSVARRRARRRRLHHRVLRARAAGRRGRGNWIQTIPGKGWFVLLRLYGPLEPFFDKTWRPGEIELVP